MISKHRICTLPGNVIIEVLSEKLREVVPFLLLKDSGFMRKENLIHE